MRDYQLHRDDCGVFDPHGNVAALSLDCNCDGASRLATLEQVINDLAGHIGDGLVAINPDIVVDNDGILDASLKGGAP